MVTSQPVFFGPHFPFEQPAHDRPADWEIWLTENACMSCVSAYVCACFIWAWYRSWELYNLLAPHRLVGHSVSRMAHWLRSNLFPGRCSYVPRHWAYHLDRGVVREEQREEIEKRCWYSGKRHCANPSLAGKVEKTSLAAQQAVTCACTTIYTVIRT